LHSEREFPGTGIGLALCKKIVTNHQGDMFAQGRVDAGSSFYVMLPVIRVYKNSSVNGI
jgi:signal transduction histidine kinase